MPYERYFNISDYIASSVSALDTYLVAATLAIAVMFLGIASANTFSVQQTEFNRNTIFGRLENGLLHFVGLSACLGMVIVFFRDSKIDPWMAFVTGMYLGMPIIGNFSLKFFINKEKALLFLSLIFVSFLYCSVSTLNQINKIMDTNLETPRRNLHFVDETYAEKQWAVIAMPSDFVILRRRVDGYILVRIKSDLKKVEDIVENRTPPPVRRGF